MDYVTTLSIIFITALTNALISGLIVDYVQKRNANLFAEELEKFKASLQKSSIEHQIRFSTSYPKTFETIETLNQKLISLQQ